MKNSPILSCSRLMLVACLAATGCADLNNPYNNPPPPYYGNGGYGNSGYYGGNYDDRRERRELERERERLENERRRLENERNRPSAPPPPPAYRPPPRAPERCPSGFSPSEQKCSREERRRGCQDMRLPGGLGCVRR